MSAFIAVPAGNKNPHAFDAGLVAPGPFNAITGRGRGSFRVGIAHSKPKGAEQKSNACSMICARVFLSSSFEGGASGGASFGGRCKLSFKSVRILFSGGVVCIYIYTHTRKAPESYMF